ncbi:MAG: DUF3501 family protein [bacterium]|nr:DUF3501 family protein [bacterium]
MKKLVMSDLLDLTEYEKRRDVLRKRIIGLKGARRVSVGNELTFIFENRDTMHFQVQEMLRAERIVEDDKIQAELDVYNELIPDRYELSATLMIEITDKDRIKKTLDRLVGIDEYVSLHIGPRVVRAVFDEKQFEEDRISAVQYLRFPLGPELAAEFADALIDVSLVVDHPALSESAVIVGDTRQSLARDLDL